MIDNELKTQIALGLINPKEIEPILIWHIQDPELLHMLAELFYKSLLTTDNYDYWPNTRRHDSIHAYFLNNPNTSTKTRIFINQIILELRKRERDD